MDDMSSVGVKPYKAICFLSEEDQNSKFTCIATAVSFKGKYFLLTSSSAIKDEEQGRLIQFKRFSRNHFGHYTVVVSFFEKLGEFTLLEIKNTVMVDGKTTWSISPLYLHPRPPFTSPGATEEFTFQFKCVGNSIKLIGRQPIVEETSILGAPIIIEQSQQFYVIGVVRLTSEGKPCPCYFNENIRGEFCLVGAHHHLRLHLYFLLVESACGSKYEPEKYTLQRVSNS